MPTQDKENKGFDAGSVTGIPKKKKAQKYEGPLAPGTTKKDASKQMDKNTANKKADTKPAVKVDTPPAPDKPVKPVKKPASGGTYASAKKKDPKLDSYIKTRNASKKGSPEYNAAQNSINSAYGKGKTNRKVEPTNNPKASSSSKVKPSDMKEDKVATEAKRAELITEGIKSGDKKAGKKAGLKGGLKRKANRAGKQVSKAGKKAVKTAKKTAKSDYKDKIKDVILSASAPTTFKDFDQMDTKNSKKTAGEGSMSTMYSDGPIKYFKQSIKYNVKEASNPSLSSSARKHYAENAQHDMKSMGKMDETMAYKHGAMKGDQSASRIDYANYKGTDKGYHGKTGASHGDQSASKADYMGKSKKGGSILSKHMKS